MIVDTFTFFNEFDILDIRFEELAPVVDRFLLVESNLTFSGNEKPLFFDGQRYMSNGRYREWSDKVWQHTHIESPGGSAWEREFRQRNAIMDGLAKMNLSDDDIILISDADEIPRREVIASTNPAPVEAFGLPAYYYGINVFGGHQHSIRSVRYGELLKSSPQAVRTLDVDLIPCQWDAGWHFSYLGDVDHIAYKFRSFAHTELNRADTNDANILAQRMRAGTDLWGDGHQYEIKTVDDTWPEAIKRDRKRWRKFEWD